VGKGEKGMSKNGTGRSGDWEVGARKPMRLGFPTWEKCQLKRPEEEEESRNK